MKSQKAIKSKATKAKKKTPNTNTSGLPVVAAHNVNENGKFPRTTHRAPEGLQIWDLTLLCFTLHWQM